MFIFWGADFILVAACSALDKTKFPLALSVACACHSGESVYCGLVKTKRKRIQIKDGLSFSEYKHHRANLPKICPVCCSYKDCSRKRVSVHVSPEVKHQDVFSHVCFADHRYADMVPADNLLGPLPRALAENTNLQHVKTPSFI